MTNKKNNTPEENNTPQLDEKTVTDSVNEQDNNDVEETVESVDQRSTTEDKVTTATTEISLAEISNSTLPDEWLNTRTNKEKWRGRVAIGVIAALLAVVIGLIVYIVQTDRVTTPIEPTTPIITDQPLTPDEEAELGKQSTVSNTAYETVQVIGNHILEQYGEEIQEVVALNTDIADVDPYGEPATVAIATFENVPLDFDITSSKNWFKENAPQIGDTWKYEETISQNPDRYISWEGVKVYNTVEDASDSLTLLISYYQLKDSDTLSVQISAIMY